MFSEEDADKLLDFIGFGNLDGPIWFLGMEEGGGNEKTIRVRLDFDEVMDLEEAHRELGITHHFGPKPQLQPTWSVLSKIALGLNGKPNDSESARRYQARELGSEDGETLVCELLPLPNPGMDHWIYADLFNDSRLEDRETYEAHVLPTWQERYVRLLEKHEPGLVICYGKTYWSRYEKLFPRAAFSQRTLKHPSEKKRQLPVDTVSYTRTHYGGQVLLISHPVTPGMNAQWRIDAIVELIESEQAAQSASRR
jgi:hypothetical protein